MITIADIEKEAEKVNTTPTKPQKEAGNYSMGHISVKGMKIAIENPRGSRRYYGDKGEYVIMSNHYGYFNVTKGKDGDAVDVFLGPDIEDFDTVYCIDQNNKDGEFDETKVMLGFKSKEEAKKAYLSNYDPNWRGFRDITAVSLKVFKRWLYRGRKQRQPFADYVYIKKKKLDEMKKVVKLSENDIMSIIKKSVKHVLNEGIDEWGDDAADMMGMYDGQDGPTNDGPDWEEVVYYKALEIMKRYDFQGGEAADAIEHIIDIYINSDQPDRTLMRMEPEEAARLVAREAMKSIDRDYYECEVAPFFEEPQVNESRVMKLSESDIHMMIKNTVKRVIMENKLTRDDDYSYQTRVDDPDADLKYNEWRSANPSREDLNDLYGGMPENDEPDILEDSTGYPIDADDEGDGFSKEYSAGVNYARNLIAKSRVPNGLMQQLEELEGADMISPFQLGMLDTLDEEL